jgi:nucleoside-diphosphate kinase
MHKHHERTVVLIKPDAVKRGLIGRILTRFEQRGLKIVALEMIQATREQVDSHYPKDISWVKRLGQKTKKTYQKYQLNLKVDFKDQSDLSIGKKIRNWTLEYLSSGPIVKLVLEGPHAVEIARKLIGESFPLFAVPGTIRGDFSIESAVTANLGKRAVYNLVHASETPREAGNELEFWFAPEQIHDYDRIDYSI